MIFYKPQLSRFQSGFTIIAMILQRIIEYKHFCTYYENISQ